MRKPDAVIPIVEWSSNGINWAVWAMYHDTQEKECAACCGRLKRNYPELQFRVAYSGAPIETGSRAILSALKDLYFDNCDYIQKNNLGDIHHNQSMKNARDALSAVLRA